MKGGLQHWAGCEGEEILVDCVIVLAVVKWILLHNGAMCYDVSRKTPPSGVLSYGESLHFGSVVKAVFPAVMGCSCTLSSQSTKNSKLGGEVKTYTSLEHAG